MAATVLITRPQAAGQRFADQIRERHGRDTPIVLSPVTQIEYLNVMPELDGVSALIFTSRHGVEAFARLCDHRDILCYAIGPATAEAAQAKGFNVSCADGDANALIRHIVDAGESGPALHLRGEHAAGEIARRLIETGLPTRECVLYRQRSLPLSDQAKDLLDRESPVILPLFSPRSAKLLFSQMQPRAPLLVVAISKNVKASVPEKALRRLWMANEPNGKAMLLALDRLFECAKRLESANRAP